MHILVCFLNCKNYRIGHPFIATFVIFGQIIDVIVNQSHDRMNLSHQHAG